MIADLNVRRAGVVDKTSKNSNFSKKNNISLKKKNSFYNEMYLKTQLEYMNNHEEFDAEVIKLAGIQIPKRFEGMALKITTNQKKKFEFNPDVLEFKFDALKTGGELEKAAKNKAKRVVDKAIKKSLELKVLNNKRKENLELRKLEKKKYIDLKDRRRNLDDQDDLLSISFVGEDQKVNEVAKQVRLDMEHDYSKKILKQVKRELFINSLEDLKVKKIEKKTNSKK